MTVDNEKKADEKVIPQEIEGTAEIAPAEQDKVFNSEVVSKIVAREREKAYEKGKREALMELEQGQAQQPDQAPAQQQSQVSMGGMQQFSPQDVVKIMQEHLPQMMQQHVQNAKQEQVIGSFVNKMKAAEEKHPGLEAELNQINWRDPRSSALAVMVNDLENTGEVMKELLDHPSKFGELLNLVDSQPHLAAKQLFSLSNSIKQNEKAVAENKRASEPMSHMKPSVNAGMDNSNASVSDFRKMQW